MTAHPADSFDPRLDLVLERVVDVAPHRVWRAWTEPAQLMQWFTPKPWQTTECEIDLRPGGLFRTVMRGPEGQENVNVGCYLEVVENRRLVWTDVLGPGFRPLSDAGTTGCPGFMTAFITLTAEGAGTRYVARAAHKDEAGRKVHEDMGFAMGWGMALDQLVALVKSD